MYKQEKYYLVLVKEKNLQDRTDGEINGFAGERPAKKIADGGLQKVTLTEQKIRVDFYLNNLPICYGISMECRLKYRQQGETTATQIWREKLVKSNSHYIFQMPLNKPVEAILDCRLHLQGGYLLVAEEKGEYSELSGGEGETGTQNKAGNEEKNGMGNKTENADGNKILTVGEIRAAEEAEKNGKIAEQPGFREIECIRDLEYLKTRGGRLADLYYNSFLLHGFYQHHYFIMGKDFIGVPDHFYEREAIAAKMMGFPYFIEGDNVENCNINGEVRKELPKVGSFGYFLKKLS